MVPDVALLLCPVALRGGDWRILFNVLLDPASRCVPSESVLVFTPPLAEESLATFSWSFINSRSVIEGALGKEASAVSRAGFVLVLSTETLPVASIGTLLVRSIVFFFVPCFITFKGDEGGPCGTEESC